MEFAETQRLFLPLWSDVLAEDDFTVRKPLLAHYTSIDVLEKIIEHGELWFSHPLLMNDHEELKFGILRSMQIIKHDTEIRAAWETNERAQIFSDSMDEAFKYFDDELAFDVYVFCMSEHQPGDTDGILSMWRGYGGNGSGAAIVFDTSKLQSPKGGPLVLAPVRYGTHQQRIEWILSTAKKFAEIIASTELADSDIRNCAWTLFERIKFFALYSKHSGFKEEQEWRVAYMRDRDLGGKFHPYLKYALGPRGAEPKLKLPIEKLGEKPEDRIVLTDIIDKIIVGPTVTSVISQRAIIRMCNTLRPGKFDGKVVASGIPFRLAP